MTGKANSGQQAFAWPPLLVVITTCWVVSLMVLVMAMAGMRYATGLTRLVPMNGLDLPAAYDSHLTVESDRERFRSGLTPIVAKQDTTEAKVLAILEWVMNQIPKVENRYAKSSWQMVEIGRAGGGLICGGMAQVFRDALIANDIPARRVFLQRNLFDRDDSHVTVEAFVNGKWRLYDPTFHLSLKTIDQRVGVQEARGWLLSRKGLRVDIEFLGDVGYPARYDSYPIRYEVLFNNAYFENERSYSAVRDLVVINFLVKIAGFGSQWGYPTHELGINTNEQDFYRFLYYTTLIVLPTINLALLLTMGLLWRKARRSRQ